MTVNNQVIVMIEI